MNCQRIILVTLVTLVITPAAVAQVYKCDGPNGPVYSDRKCGADAASVEIRESSGLSGVTEQDKNALAEKKLEREQTQSQNQQGVVVNNQNNTYTTENPDRLRDRDNAKTPLDKPLPATLPTKPQPAVPRKKRDNG
jgi:hypothetical protein